MFYRLDGGGNFLRGDGMVAEPKFNVVAVNIKTGERRVLERNKSERDAEAIVNMAVMRRGVEEEFFTTESVKV